ncbi:MAG: hypothetical protein JNM56_15610 [Planctomycetia bacterium]|nr:hypothetical protein [Planctomycetia bacterium]
MTQPDRTFGAGPPAALACRKESHRAVIRCADRAVAGNIKMFSRGAIAMAAFFVYASLPLGAAVSLPRVFGDSMVLQRDQAVPVWGTARPGERITVAFQGQERMTSADAQGRWRVDLAPMPAQARGQPLTVRGENTITLRDVLVGEVWIGAGQSNMDTPVLFYPNLREPARKLADRPSIRYFGLPGLGYGVAQLPEQQRCRDDTWTVLNPDTVLSCSAMQFFFALRLHEALDVPVGILCRGVGSSQAGVWVRNEAVAEDLECRKAVERAAAACHEHQLEQHRRETAAVKHYNSHRQDGQAELPAVSAPPSKPAWEARASGKLYATRIVPLQPFAVRGVLWDQGEGGMGNTGTGITGMHMLPLMSALIRSWRADWGRTAEQLPFVINQKPSGRGWRGRFTPFAPDPDFPTLDDTEFDGNGSYGRHWQYWMIGNPRDHVFMVNTMGLISDIHPPDKDAYGRRMADVVLARVHGRTTPHQTPVLASCRNQGRLLQLTFDAVGQGLQAVGVETLHGFTVAGEDKVFFPARARIIGTNQIEVESARVPQPVSVRYADGNLVSGDGYQSFPFRAGAEGVASPERAGPVLVKLLERPGPIRRQAAACLFGLGSHESEAVAAMRTELLDDTTRSGEVTYALMTFQGFARTLPRDPRTLDRLAHALGQALTLPKLNDRHRLMAIECLRRLGPHGLPAVDTLGKIAKGEEGEVSRAARAALTAMTEAKRSP